MSLLMDALKKAEQEKKEAAKRQQASQESDALASDTNLQQDLNNTWEHEITGSGPDSATPSADSTMRSTTAELSLEPMQAQEKEADTTAEIGVSEIASEDPTLNVAMSELDKAEMSADRAGLAEQGPEGKQQADIADLQIENSAASMDETLHGIALQSEAEDSELFQETLQGEAYVSAADTGGHSYDETLPGVPAAQLAIDIGGGDDQPTPVAAQTVFAATGTVQGSSFGFRWLLAVLCVVAMVAGSVWYFVTVTPMNRTLPSPLVAEGIEKNIPDVLVTEVIARQPVSGTLTGASSLATDGANPVAGTEIVETNILPVEAAASLTATESTADDAVLMEPASTASSSEEIIADIKPSSAISASAEELPLTEASLPETITLEPSLIKISRSKSTDNKGQLVNDAFAAYQAGDFATALAAYQEALKLFPGNTDALQGLGAIAMGNGDTEDAIGIYLHLLKLDPVNAVAKAVLISLQDSSNALNNESAVKSMIYENPDRPYLHFILGNIYASEYRWAEAQQAFFKAYTYDSSSPDYAMNLAIALDYMGQKDTALDYYHVALKLADERPASFDITPVMIRIQSLSSVVKRP